MRQEESGDAQDIDWRAQFISLAEDVCRVRNRPATAIVDDPDNYLVLEVQVDGLAFEILHFPDAMERLVVHCRIGAVPGAHEAGLLKGALMANTALASSHAGMFALDSETGELVYSTAESLRELTAEQLLQNMSTMVSATEPWARHCTHPSA